MKLRRLNSTGIEHFRNWLNGLREGQQADTPNLLQNTGFSEELEWDVDVENRDFQSRYELGTYLVNKLAVCDEKAIRNDAGLWTWLALFWFDRLCPADSNGTRKPKRDDNYILSTRYRDHHRHAIRTTWLFVKEHGDKVGFIFSNPLSQRGELTEQLTARPYFLNCKGLMEAAWSLYKKPHQETWKAGAAGNGSGSVRRFALILKQLELTYDLYSMGKEDILSVLPQKEFARFIAAP
ncbi:hypothetical protein [Chloracidobacterium aggregatum]|uniref:Uncharacterized protein n=1 Tax=Chloracidobacterium sp. N TaxID=2821540 RepID=A0ABX8AZ18_9BACT|nr:hypothetical protein [Chloracidobacterium aggregatum]QUV83675.1 hypothetical protein J8C03_05725 [Chloracidobacterium sp. 2]QUV90741.1 hypothetical protein J8C04_10940 [Chloracidobacterium sp. A]QUV93958.1 hypothetical protein J8C05_00370 [Chloracidobacterium sp. N]QUV97150.1 hypothetical protein J8C00_01405 [Chloracidobacterium sp. E]